jgi:hypothetical protein
MTKPCRLVARNEWIICTARLLTALSSSPRGQMTERRQGFALGFARCWLPQEVHHANPRVRRIRTRLGTDRSLVLSRASAIDVLGVSWPCQSQKYSNKQSNTTLTIAAIDQPFPIASRVSVPPILNQTTYNNARSNRDIEAQVPQTARLNNSIQYRFPATRQC